MTQPNIDVARLRALLAKATPGPWIIAAGCPQYICNGGKWLASTMGVRGAQGEVNAALIVEAVNSLPALLDAFEALRVENEGLRADAECYHRQYIRSIMWAVEQAHISEKEIVEKMAYERGWAPPYISYRVMRDRARKAEEDARSLMESLADPDDLVAAEQRALAAERRVAMLEKLLFRQCQITAGCDEFVCAVTDECCHCNDSYQEALSQKEPE